MNREKILRKLDDIVINSKNWSFWNDTTIQDVELDEESWTWKILITKWWDHMCPFYVDIRFTKLWSISFLKTEKELDRAFKKKYE